MYKFSILRSVYQLNMLNLSNFSHYSDILKKLIEILNRETYRRAIDNICAALCRMIMAHSEAVPLDQVKSKYLKIY